MTENANGGPRPTEVEEEKFGTDYLTLTHVEWNEGIHGYNVAFANGDTAEVPWEVDDVDWYIKRESVQWDKPTLYGRFIIRIPSEPIDPDLKKYDVGVAITSDHLRRIIDPEFARYEAMQAAEEAHISVPKMVGMKLKRLREEKELTLEQIRENSSDTLEIGTIQRMEDGDYDFTISELVRVLSATDSSLEDLDKPMSREEQLSRMKSLLEKGHSTRQSS